ncbi:MAG: methyltransferase [Heliobacteriaceae bacterium]|nr:methyltransferase [Heliobacteriaceae bacterium]
MFLMNRQVPGSVVMIDRILEGFKAFQVVKSAVDLNLFDWLASNGPSSLDTITTGLKINGMLIRSYLQALVELGLIDSNEGLFANTQLAATFFVRSNPSYQGDYLKNLGEDPSWRQLGEILTQDQFAGLSPGPNQENFRALNQQALRGEVQAVTNAVIAWPGFAKAKSLLDLSGGHGLYAIALCEVHPDLTGRIFDQPGFIPFTRQNIAEFGLTSRLHTVAGDLKTADWGQGADLLLASHVLYQFRKDLPGIFARFYQALRPGGLLVLNHWFCSPGCIMTNGLNELTKSLQSLGHPLCHPDRFAGLLHQAGFTPPVITDIPSIYGVSKLCLATKKTAADLSRRCC